MEIWQPEWKFGKFLRLSHENNDFAIFCHFCFLNIFFVQSQIRIPFVLRQPLNSVVYDFAFNSILQFLVKYGILPSRVRFDTTYFAEN